MQTNREIFVSVDVETAGPYPENYALLSVGACLAEDTSKTFYVELKPLQPEAVPEAMEICGFSIAELTERGTPAEQAMLLLAAWLEEVVPPGARPVFVAFNAPFDWSFVNYYFHRFLGYNPFGHNAVDIKAYFMGLTGVSWAETSLRQVAARLGGSPELSHNALDDAIEQGTLFKTMLEMPRGSQYR